MSAITVQAIVCDTPRCRGNSQSQVLNHAGLWQLECDGWTVEAEPQGKGKPPIRRHYCPKCTKVLPPPQRGRTRHLAPKDPI